MKQPRPGSVQGRMLRRKTIIATLLLVSATGLSMFAVAGEDAEGVPAGEPAFAGTEACARCHAKETRAWRESAHGRHALAVAEPDGGADGAVGSSWMQAYFRRDARGYHRIAPDCFDLRKQAWRAVDDVLEEIAGTWPGGEPPPVPPLDQRSFEVDCSGCHASQTRLRLDPATGHMAARWNDLAINCETCHGPGGAHARAWDRLDDGEPMARLSKLSPRARNAICARCHGGPETVGDFGPSDAPAFVALLEDRKGLFPDGSASGQVYQYLGFVRSPCSYKGGLTCTGCHEAHGSDHGRPRQVDEPCIRCHQEKASRTHTHHDPRGEGARCVACHMPTLLGGLMAHQREHRIGSPLPASPYVPDACSTCHKWSKAWADRSYRRWWGAPPQGTLEAIEAVYLARGKRPEARPLLKGALSHPDPFFRAAAGLYLRDGTGIRLDPLPEVRFAAVRAGLSRAHLLEALEDPEPRVRAAAALEFSERGEPVRAEQVPDLEVTARHARALVQPRMILGVWHVQQGDPAAAVGFFEEALAFRPSHDAWLGLATALEALGRDRAAGHAHLRRAELLKGLLMRRASDAALALATSEAFVAAGERPRAVEVLTRVQPHLRSDADRTRIRGELRRVLLEGKR